MTSVGVWVVSGTLFGRSDGRTEGGPLWVEVFYPV